MRQFQPETPDRTALQDTIFIGDYRARIREPVAELREGGLQIGRALELLPECVAKTRIHLIVLRVVDSRADSPSLDVALKRISRPCVPDFPIVWKKPVQQRPLFRCSEARTKIEGCLRL